MEHLHPECTVLAQGGINPLGGHGALLGCQLVAQQPLLTLRVCSMLELLLETCFNTGVMGQVQHRQVRTVLDDLGCGRPGLQQRKGAGLHGAHQVLAGAILQCGHGGHVLGLCRHAPIGRGFPKGRSTGTNVGVKMLDDVLLCTLGRHVGGLVGVAVLAFQRPDSV